MSAAPSPPDESTPPETAPAAAMPDVEDAYGEAEAIIPRAYHATILASIDQVVGPPSVRVTIFRLVEGTHERVLVGGVRAGLWDIEGACYDEEARLIADALGVVGFRGVLRFGRSAVGVVMETRFLRIEDDVPPLKATPHTRGNFALAYASPDDLGRALTASEAARLKELAYGRSATTVDGYGLRWADDGEAIEVRWRFKGTLTRARIEATLRAHGVSAAFVDKEK